MDKFIKAIAALLCATSLFWGCTPSPTPDVTALHIASEAMPTDLDPRYATDAYASRVAGLVFASLVRPAPDGGYHPYLASRWEMPDDRTWMFHLRADFSFHDGSLLTGADVVATYRSLMDPGAGSPRRGLLGQLAVVEAPTPDTVVFKLNRPDGAFLEAATLAVLPARLCAQPRLAPVQLTGAGPYKLVRAGADGRIRLEAFERFPLGIPSLPAIEFRVVPDGLMRALELRHGNIDLIQNALDPDTVEWMSKHQADTAIHRGPSSNIQYLGMNLEHPLLRDARVRRAIAYAVDREAIVRHVLKGQAHVADGLLPPQHWAYTPRKRHYRYDPARARRLLDRAGVIDPDGSGPLPRANLSYKTTTQDISRRTAEALMEQLEAVGIRLEVSSYDWATFFDDVRNGRFHLYALQWVGITDPDMYRQVLHSDMIPPHGNNRNHYRNARMDRLTEDAVATCDRDRRRRLYARVQRIEARDLPHLPLWWPERIVVATRRLTGFTPAPSGDLFALYLSRLAPKTSDR